jgi:hypothetical protein
MQLVGMVNATNVMLLACPPRGKAPGALNAAMLAAEITEGQEAPGAWDSCAALYADYNPLVRRPVAVGLGNANNASDGLAILHS